jgi:hypothetical protein
MQYGTEQRNQYNITAFETIINSAREEAKQAGAFTPDIINRMTENIANQFDIDGSEITINVSPSKKYRTNEFDERELIEYEIGIPLKELVAANRLWGISDDENRTIHYVRGAVPSEALEELP